ncbi:MAG: hypothetical protein GKS06_19325 [Acidobacteria bacterium]|nr:hypothetical protein [Acidobacteriota bacterium]
MKKRQWFALGIALMAMTAWMVPGEPAVLTNPPIASIGALEFADGKLLAGDSLGGAIYALEVSGSMGERGEFAAVNNLDVQIADMLGTTTAEIFIKDLAVDQASGAAYLSLMRGSGADAQPALIRVDPDGTVNHVPFDALQYTTLQLTDAPDSDPESRRNPRNSTITDIELVGDQVFIAGLSNEEFASVLRRAPWPFDESASATGLEIYHGAHGQFETHAPVYTFMPLELDGEQHVLAGYLCTPLVTFAIDELENSHQLRGKTIAELGFGNVPVDMLLVTQEGEDFVLLTNSRRGTMKIPVADIAEAHRNPSIEERVGPRTGVDYEGSPMGLVVQVDTYGDDAVMVLERNPENGTLTLSVRGSRWV